MRGASGIQKPGALDPKTRDWFLVGQLEIDADFCLDLDGVAVQQIRLVFPLLHGVYGGLGQELVAADDFYFGDVSGLADGCHQLDGPFDAHAESGGRIRGLNFLQQKTLRNSLRDGESLKDGFGGIVARRDIGQ
jgi:hypothetical protein